MTRKDYVGIAGELRLSRPSPDDMTDHGRSKSTGFALAVEAIARALANDNERFDSERFYSAVYDR